MLELVLELERLPKINTKSVSNRFNKKGVRITYLNEQEKKESQICAEHSHFFGTLLFYSETIPEQQIDL